MPDPQPSRRKPVTLEERKSLLHGSKRRRSVASIVVLSVIALVVGLVIALFMRQVLNIQVSGESRIQKPSIRVAEGHLAGRCKRVSLPSGSGWSS